MLVETRDFSTTSDYEGYKQTTNLQEFDSVLRLSNRFDSSPNKILTIDKNSNVNINKVIKSQ